MAQERENGTRHDDAKQRQPPESCRRRQQQRPPTSSSPPQTRLKPLGKLQRAKSAFTVPRPLILIVPATRNTTAKVAVRMVGINEASFAIINAPIFPFGSTGLR